MRKSLENILKEHVIFTAVPGLLQIALKCCVNNARVFKVWGR